MRPRLPALDYESLFHAPKMFDSKRSFAAAGFSVKASDGKHIMVGSHPLAPAHLFKKYSRDVPRREQRENYEERVRGAQAIRHLIERRRLRHLVVPHKWIYELPHEFGEGRRSRDLLVVEQIQLLDMEATLRSYRTISDQVLEDLCHVLHRFRGFDAAIHNLRFTPGVQIDFIDTESCSRHDRKGTRVFRR